MCNMCFSILSVRIPLVQLQKVVADVTQILSLTFGTMCRLVIILFFVLFEDKQELNKFMNCIIVLRCT